MEWTHDGYQRFSEKKVHQGPNLQKLDLSRSGFVLGVPVPQDFTIDGRRGTFGSLTETRQYCVAEINPISRDKVNLHLVDRPHDSDHGYYVIYGYNHKRCAGGRLIYFKRDDRPKMRQYDPARLPDGEAMMLLSDTEFIMAYAARMLSYTQHERYIFPLRCAEPGCSVPIRHHLDMRKLGGQCLCPESFPRMIEETGSDYEWLARAARILPDRCLSVPLYPLGIENEGNVRG